MNKDEQAQLALELSLTFCGAYLQMAENAPDNWTGVELRQLLVDCAEERFIIDMDKERMKSYRNDRRVVSGL